MQDLCELALDLIGGADKDLAQMVGVSRSSFMTQFTAVVGETPGAYLTSWRLALGRRELTAGRSVKAVAARVGFGSAAAFSRAFSRKYGHPPGTIGKVVPACPRISALESEP